MNYDINNILENLKSNLEKIDSSRMQVENTINAYGELKGKVQIYTKSFQTLAVDVKNLIDATTEQKDSMLADLNNSLMVYKEACNETNHLFNENCENTISAFDSKLTNNTIQFDNRLNELKQQIHSLNKIETSFIESIEQINSVNNKLDNCTTKEEHQNHTTQLQSLIEHNFTEIKSQIKDVETIWQKEILTHNEQTRINTNTIHCENKRNTKLLYGALILLIINIILHFI